MFKRKGGGVKGFLNNIKKTAFFLTGRLPLGKPSATKSAVFLNIVQKAFDPPSPPFV